MYKGRLYSLFERQNGKWIRITKLAYKKPIAVRLFQTELLKPSLQGIDGVLVKGVRELRPVRQP